MIGPPNSDPANTDPWHTDSWHTDMAAPVTDFERGGSASVEAALIAVVVGLVLAFAFAVGRVAVAESAVGHAARAAARAASLERDPVTANLVARRAADIGLDERGLRCTRLDITIDTSGFAASVGVPAAVTVTVRCAVDWADLALPGAPGVREVQAQFASPLDQWRERP